MKRLLLLAASSLSALVLLSACGNEPFMAPPAPILSGSAVSFSVISTATLPVGITAIQARAVLPSSVTVYTDPANPKQINAASLAYGSAITTHANNLIYGSYSAGAASNIVKITVMTPNQEFRMGEFAKLTVVTTLSLADFRAANVSPLIALVGGYDAVAGSTIDLSGKTAVTISAVTAL